MEQKAIEELNTKTKEVKLNFGEKIYKCQIKIFNKYLQVSLCNNNIIKYEGYIHLSRIQSQIFTFIDYTINEIFYEINKLKNDKFKLINEENNWQIEFIILDKKRYLNIELYENININENNEYLLTINKLKEIIKEKDNKIKFLEEELNKYKSKKNDDIYDNFNIENKEPKHILKYHAKSVNTIAILNDGRFAAGSDDNSIIIYNNKTFLPDLTIKEHQDMINSVIKLSSSDLASCSADNTIKLFRINANNYKVIQVLNYHKNSVSKIVELKNKQLVSCSLDKSIIFYNKNNNEYIKDYSISTNGRNGPIIQIKDNEICFYEEYDIICFFDIFKRNYIRKVYNISAIAFFCNSLLMISNDILLITGLNKISILNVNTHNLIRTINVVDSGQIYDACMLNKNMMLTADENKRIIQWKIEYDNLKIIYIKENCHDNSIYALAKLGNGLILSGGDDCCLKIW